MPEILPGTALGPGLKIRGRLIHDPASPLANALAEVKNLEKAERGLILCFGLGLGYHFQAVLSQWPDARIIAFEADAELRRAFEDHGPASDLVPDRLRIASTWTELNNLLTEELVHGPHPTPAVFVIPEYQKLFPDRVKTFKRLVFEALVRRRVSDHTWKEKGALFLANLADNLGNILNLPLITGLKPGPPAPPAFIVGSGPGLEKNGRLLVEARAKGLVLAASSAVKPLAAMGVRPDIVVFVEAEDTSRFLPPDLAHQDIILAIGSAAHPNHFQIPGFTNSFFHLTRGAAFICGEESFVPQAGTAGAAAFTLAFIMGLRPLVLVGQDQAFAPDRVHASGTPGDIPLTPDLAPYTVAGATESRVRTHAAFAASLHWFAESARYLKQKSPRTALLNASESGASIPGLPNVTLREVLDHLPRPSSPPPRPAESVPRLAKPSLEAAGRAVRETWNPLLQAEKVLRYRPEDASALVLDLRTNHPFLKEALAGIDPDAGPREIRTKIEAVEAEVLKMMEVLG
ncbi:MAG: 6-hydroxymethylpterin diphosphokinase MptE-like protein [Pseudomonadota bacterium]